MRSRLQPEPRHGLNHLLYRQQIELMRADAARCEPSKVAHRELARLYMIEVKRFAQPIRLG